MGENTKPLRFEIVKKIAETNFKVRNLNNISKIDGTSPPSVFVGSKLKYPLVNVGIMSPLERDEDAWIYDAEPYWAKNNFEISDVLRLRNSLLNSRFQSKATDVRLNNKFVTLAQEIAISSKSVDVEIELKNRLRIGRGKDQVVTPHGMSAPLKKARITSNVSVDRNVDKVINDDIKAVQGIELLYKKNFTEYTLNKILSIGVLGLKKNKKIVPTRWSITATDDMIGKHLHKNIRDYPWVEDYTLHFGEFLGNSYIILFFPGVWSYELFELYLPGSSWNPTTEIKASTDFEGYSGRKSYAFNTVGGYYASRLPILEYLNKIKRQASVLVIRVEQPTYWAALGVWVCREACRKTLDARKIILTCKDELVTSAKNILLKKLKLDLNHLFKQSKLLNTLNTQRNLNEFF